VKGLYDQAFRGEIPEFTGVSDPYEEPESPEVRVETEGRSPEASAREVLDYLTAVTA
jgi:adenylylsulfate kinase-like enzyme